jgi:hypothetical protein
MGGARWGGTDNFGFSEEKHDTGYCLELWSHKVAQVPIGVKPVWVELIALVDRLTVPQVEDLADHLSTWAKTMREGGHYRNGTIKWVKKA